MLLPLPNTLTLKKRILYQVFHYIQKPHEVKYSKLNSDIRNLTLLIIS